MYDELIKQLKYCANSNPICEATAICPFYDQLEEETHDYRCVERMMSKAADAIGELQKQLREEEVDNVNLTGWIAEEHAKHLWIPVTERLPEIGKKVLVLAYGHDVLTARLRKETENDYPVFKCNGIYLEMAKHGRITHWMPLPEPPTIIESGVSES